MRNQDLQTSESGLTITIAVAEKLLVINDKSMKLEDSFTDVSIGGEGGENRLTLRYVEDFTKADSLVEREMDKLRETYGEELSERVNVSGCYLDDAYYLSFVGEFNPRRGQ